MIARLLRHYSQLTLTRKISHSSVMAKSKFEYTRKFEEELRLLPNCWIVVRIDGKGFHKFSDAHNFAKPNEKAALDLMNKCACNVMNEFNEIILSYGQSDEYSFVFRWGRSSQIIDHNNPSLTGRPDTAVYSRRSDKIVTNIVSLFASSYVFHWQEFFPANKLLYPPR